MPIRGPRTPPERLFGEESESGGEEGVGSVLSVRHTKERMETQKEIMDLM